MYVSLQKYNVAQDVATECLYICQHMYMYILVMYQMQEFVKDT